MQNQTLEEMKRLDEAAEKAGGYVADNGTVRVHYNYRKIIQHCKEKNIFPQDMTLRELDRFIVQ